MLITGLIVGGAIGFVGGIAYLDGWDGVKELAVAAWKDIKGWFAR